MAKSKGPKQRILETAARLFYEQGYHTTGINQILAEANVAKASLYQHYGSKDEVGLAYLRSQREMWFAALDKRLATLSTPTDQLLALFDHIEQSLSFTQFRGCRFINLLTEIGDDIPLMREEIVGHKTKLRELFQQLMTASLGSDAAPAKTQALADAMYLLFEGALVESKLYRDSWPVKVAKRTVQALLTA